ncbi:hydrogenase maturation nickel metallochaperone HypA [Pseudonocardia eucalypti]|uniref:Hydrogenase maturation factor HypA n=1 Tax=Pseudonocardia eucalypti TaxID=648755 RepID=A0ABP9QLV7_9PSEU|nr:hydrogenase nickel incorporation protein HypA/HybF [Pseudonocardia eucalypti]
MHELAITESIVAAVTERLPDTRIRVLWVEIGRLSGVVPDAVRFCFDLVVAGTPLEGARLEIDEPAGRVHCRSCAAEFDTDQVLALCACGSADVHPLRGTELCVRQVEVV